MYHCMCISMKKMVFVWIATLSFGLLVAHASTNQDPVERFNEAQTLMVAEKFQEALNILEPLCQEYTGQAEFRLSSARCYIELNQVANGFLRAAEIGNLVQKLIVMPGASKADIEKATEHLTKMDDILLHAITLLESDPSIKPLIVTNAKVQRAQALHSAGLGMLSTRTTSGWGRRALAHAHAATVLAHNSDDLDCERKIVWGWDSRVPDPHVTLYEIALPTSLDIQRGYIPTYFIGPEPNPVFQNHHSPSSGFWTDVSKVYFVNFKQVWLDAHAGGQVWGVYYSQCYVYSMSKLHNAIIHQGYRGTGHAEVIDEPVISAVFASQTNYYHVLIETLPKLLFLESELRHGRQIPWLKQKPYGAEMKILAPNLPIVRSMLALIGIEESRIIFVSSDVGKRYLLKNCVVVEFGPPPGAYSTTASSSKKKQRVVKYPDPREHVQLMKSPDRWDGTPHIGSNLWATYRVPRSAMKMLRTAFPSPYDTSPDSITLLEDGIPVVNIVYTARASGSRLIKGLGEQHLIDRIQNSLGRDAVLTIHTGEETLSEQRELFGNTSIIIGPHGAGLANQIYLPIESSVIRFPLLPDVEQCFEYMAAALGHHYSDVEGFVSHHAGHYELKETWLDKITNVLRDHIRIQRKVLAKKLSKKSNLYDDSEDSDSQRVYETAPADDLDSSIDSLSDIVNDDVYPDVSSTTEQVRSRTRAAQRIAELESKVASLESRYAMVLSERDIAREKVKELTDQNLSILRRMQRAKKIEL